MVKTKARASKPHRNALVETPKPAAAQASAPAPAQTVAEESVALVVHEDAYHQPAVTALVPTRAAPAALLAAPHGATGIELEPLKVTVVLQGATSVVEPLHVNLNTPAMGLVPDAHAEVRPFDVSLSTGSTAAFPSTRLSVKPWDIRFGVGDLNFRIRPFSFTRDDG